LIELFAADIRQIAPRADKLVRLLDEKRQTRVRAYGDSDNALRSLAAGLLLYDVFGEAARNTRFVHGRRGKPSLPLHQPFNLTHAGDYAVLAVSEQAVGVDVERVRAINWEKLSARFFHPHEQQFLRESDDPVKQFFTVWTLKESYLKAEGQGFSVSPRTFSILPLGNSAVFEGGTGYHFRSFDAFPGYRLSVCGRENDIADGVSIRTF
jgi:4'-phosphopantetheinyl transferase